MIPSSPHHAGQSAADVVVQLLPPQIPAFLLGAGRQSFFYPPAALPAAAGAAGQPFWAQAGSRQQQVDHAARQQQHHVHVQQQQPSTAAQLQQASSSSRAASNNTSSRRQVPTASGASPSPSSSSSRAGRAPLDIVLRGITAGGIGAGAGGMVRLTAGAAARIEQLPFLIAVPLLSGPRCCQLSLRLRCTPRAPAAAPCQLPHAAATASIACHMLRFYPCHCLPSILLPPLQFCGPANAFQLRLWPLGGSSRSTSSNKKQKTVLIMMSNTGGMAATAVTPHRPSVSQLFALQCPRDRQATPHPLSVCVLVKTVPALTVVPECVCCLSACGVLDCLQEAATRHQQRRSSRRLRKSLGTSTR